MLGATLPTPLYPLYQEAFAFGELVTTLVFAVYAAGVIAALVLAGGWSDRIGRRPMLRAGLALSAASALVFLFADAPGWLFAGRVLSGLSTGIFAGTASAAIADLAPGVGKGRASLVAAAVNTGGLGVGPVLAGVLAQHAPHPLALCFVVDLVLVAVAAVGVEAVAEPVRRVGSPRLRPQPIVVPAEVRGVFARAVVAGFAGFAVLGLFTAVSPAFLGTVLHNTDHAVTGLVVLVVFAASVLGQAWSSVLGTRRALAAGCAGLVAGATLVGASLPAASLAVLVLGAAVAGAGQGLTFRAGLGSVVESCPPDRRGAVTSGYFVAFFTGISVPVIGVGTAAEAFGLVVSGTVFAALLAILAAVALVLTVRAGRG
ncbi:MFS transporter [Saccharothrix syringae]|uniref:MFS transporter n=2 Tax=Saccharothrix syringae TaxID=103733 RepID=A0A5Q0HEH5_SACSY|nr:MFS transporter [Saccharothrix syringae]